jgi:uncharacterized protein YaiL (DUF2058 family)
MAGLRDQLLKSGLVNEKQVKKAQKEKIKEQRGQGKAADPSDVKMRLQQAQAEKNEKDRLLNQQRKEEADRKALAAQVRQLVETQRLPGTEGEIPFYFTDGGKIKKWRLNQKSRDQLVKGQTAIVKLDDQYAIVPRETSEKISRRMAEAVVLQNDADNNNQGPAADDPYAAYQVPDDLIW